MNKIISNKRTNGADANSFTPIENNNWNYKSDVKANFSLQHDDNNIYIQFKVSELNTKAVYTSYNEAVWEDSCVEFFISFDGENYYNLEFNCIGNLLGSYGSGKQNRTELSTKILSNINTTPSLGRNKIEIINRPTEWTLEVIIPRGTFCFNDIKSFNDMKATGNFYKCGDKQAAVHFLSWNPIKSAEPNFHLPEYFGAIEFA